MSEDTVALTTRELQEKLSEEVMRDERKKEI